MGNIQSVAESSGCACIGPREDDPPGKRKKNKLQKQRDKSKEAFKQKFADKKLKSKSKNPRLNWNLKKKKGDSSNLDSKSGEETKKNGTETELIRRKISFGPTTDSNLKNDKDGEVSNSNWFQGEKQLKNKENEGKGIIGSPNTTKKLESSEILVSKKFGRKTRVKKDKPLANINAINELGIINILDISSPQPPNNNSILIHITELDRTTFETLKIKSKKDNSAIRKSFTVDGDSPTVCQAEGGHSDMVKSNQKQVSTGENKADNLSTLEKIKEEHQVKEDQHLGKAQAEQELIEFNQTAIAHKKNEPINSIKEKEPSTQLETTINTESTSQIPTTDIKIDEFDCLESPEKINKGEPADTHKQENDNENNL